MTIKLIILRFSLLFVRIVLVQQLDQVPEYDSTCTDSRNYSPYFCHLYGPTELKPGLALLSVLSRERWLPCPLLCSFCCPPQSLPSKHLRGPDFPTESGRLATRFVFPLIGLDSFTRYAILMLHLVTLRG